MSYILLDVLVLYFDIIYKDFYFRNFDSSLISNVNCITLNILLKALSAMRFAFDQVENYASATAV